MIRLSGFLVVLILVSACQKPQLAVSAEKVDAIVRCGSVIDGLTDTLAGETYFAIRNQRISAILTGDNPAMADVETVDLRGYTCLPGLIDMHVHFDGLPEYSDDYTIFLRKTPDDLRRLLVSS